MGYAPATFRSKRMEVAKDVEEMLIKTDDYQNLSLSILLSHPKILQALRSSTSPPIAVDRLVGLASTTRNLVRSLEKGKIPRMEKNELNRQVSKILEILDKLLDRDIFPWLSTRNTPASQERERAATIIADRMCGSLSDPLIRNQQEIRQLMIIEKFLIDRGYEKKKYSSASLLKEMEPGTYSLRRNIFVGAGKKTKIPVDVVVQPKKLRKDHLPLLIEAKSAGDYANVNKRRKEEAQKMNQLRQSFSDDICYILFLGGYFNAGYLGYSASEGLDWIWEHRISDLSKFEV